MIGGKDNRDPRDAGPDDGPSRHYARPVEMGLRVMLMSGSNAQKVRALFSLWKSEGFISDLGITAFNAEKRVRK